MKEFGIIFIAITTLFILSIPCSIIYIFIKNIKIFVYRKLGFKKKSNRINAKIEVYKIKKKTRIK